MSYSNEIFDLLEAVKITDKITDEEWKKGLSDRKIKEIEQKDIKIIHILIRLQKHLL